MLILGPVNVKRKYNADWALVTGAGSGIGKSIAEKMASQGLNVVLVSLPDQFLDDTFTALVSQFPSQKFIKVATKFDLSTDYMAAIIEATENLNVNVVFNNAGYIVTDFFDQTTLDAQLNNLECNATACVKVTHHFLKKMMSKKMKGCIVYTSSLSAFIPNPFVLMYGATKAFISQFAASLAIEVRNSGIDVLAVHPSPVLTNFFDQAHRLDCLELAKVIAMTPDSVAQQILTCIGRCHFADLGASAMCLRCGMALMPYDFITGLFAFGAPYLHDFQKYTELRERRRSSS